MIEDARPKLVAETDALGRVTHVCLTMPDWKIPSADDALDPLQSVLESSEFHGASKQDISDWLLRHWKSNASKLH